MNNEPRWYVLGDDGSAMLCVGEEDAREHVHFCNVEHPLTAPHRAAQLVEADELDRLRARVAELERALLLIEPSGDFSGWEDKHGRDIGNSINAALAKDGA